MSIIFIDYLSYWGHKNFNKIHIESLLDLGFHLHLVGRAGFFKEFEGFPNVTITVIPEIFYKNYLWPALTSRLLMVASLIWIRIRIKGADKGMVVVSAYDILSFWLFRTKGTVFVINHNNVEQLKSKIKLRLTRMLPKNYIHIALNNNMVIRLKELLPSYQTELVPHGTIMPSSSFKRPSFLQEQEVFLFCPVNQNFDDELFKNIINSAEVKSYLKEHNISFYIKKQLGSIHESSVLKWIDARLIDEEYNYMIKKSLAVVLPYKTKDFQYRCSGILFECFAFNSKIITTCLPSMKEYISRLDVQCFDDPQSFISCIEYCLSCDGINYDTSIFLPTPYWKCIFQQKNISK